MIRRLAQNNIFNVPTSHREPEDAWITKVYLVSSIEALQVEGYTIILEKDGERITFDGTK